MARAKEGRRSTLGRAVSSSSAAKVPESLVAKARRSLARSVAEVGHPALERFEAQKGGRHQERVRVN